MACGVHILGSLHHLVPWGGGESVANNLGKRIRKMNMPLTATICMLEVEREAYIVSEWREIHVVNGLESRVEVFSILTRWIFYDTYVLLVQDATICNVVWNMCYTRGIGISLPNNAEQKLSVGFNLSLELHCSTWENRVQIHKTLLCTKILFHCIASNGI